MLASCGTAPESSATTIALATSTASPISPVPSSEAAKTTLPITLPRASPPATSAPLSTSTCAAVRFPMVVNGRSMTIEIPSTTRPSPIVVAIHGYKGTPEGLERYSGLSMLAATGDALVVYPPGSPLDLGFGWNSGSAKFATKSGDDVAVIADVLTAALAFPCADAERVFLVGESNGGGMALRAACDSRLSERVSGVILVNAAVDAGVLSSCSTVASPVNLFAVAGLEDSVVPYDGSRQPFVAAETWFSAAAQSLAGCSDGYESTVALSSTAEAHVAAGCAACAVLVSLTDGGHTWPGAAEGVNGAHPGTFALTERLHEAILADENVCALA